MHQKTDLIYKEEVYKIVGAAMNVYNELGPGFLEAVYQEALEIEFGIRDIPFKSQREIQVYFKKRPLKKFYIVDFLLFEKIVVEIKALRHISSIDEAQLLNELKATGMILGLLINFGSTSILEWKRMINSK